MVVVVGEEAVLAILTQGVIVVVRLSRLQSCLNGGQAGVGDGRGRQTGILIQVVFGVGLLVAVGNAALMIGQRIQQRGVHLQVAVGAALVSLAVQTVVDDRGDLILVSAVGFLLDERSNGDNFLQVVTTGLGLLQQIVVQLAVKVVDEACLVI